MTASPTSADTLPPNVLLKLTDVTTYRGSNRVFEQFNLTLDRGVNTAVIGPNGAGKSTLLKLIARELYAQSGTVHIFGQQRWNVWELRRRLGVVSADLQQNYSPTATGWSVVLSGFHSSNNTFVHQSFDDAMLSRASQICQQLEITSLVDRPFSKMSTGQQRRFLLARALVHNPETLIWDEPTTGLDVRSKFQCFAIMRDLMQAGKTIVLVTHDITEVLPEFQQVVLLKNGKVFAQDKKEDVLTSENLSKLYDTRLQVQQSGGYFHVVPEG